jgi:hypothetical protein
MEVMKAKVNKHMASPHRSCHPQHTAPLLLPMPRCTAPAAHATPHRSCRPQRTAPLLLPMPRRTAPAAHATPHHSCCPCPAAPPSLSVVIGRRCQSSFVAMVGRFCRCPSSSSSSVVVVVVGCCRLWSWLSVVVVVVGPKKSE